MPTLPKELEGKTPEEIAEFYQGQMQQQKSVYEQALEAVGKPETPSVPNQPAKPTPVTMAQFLANPDEATRKIIAENGVTREEFTAASASVQEMMIRQAKEWAKRDLDADAQKAGGTIDWARMDPLLDDIAKKCDPQSLTRIETWKTAFNYNLGQMHHTFVKEAVTRATMPAETVTPGGNRPDPKKPLTVAEESVAEGLGLTAESYNMGRDNMTQQKFPLTMDNRNRR